MRGFRTVLWWQLAATVILALAAAIPWGLEGAKSALLGGLVNVAAGAAYAWIVSRRKTSTAWEALATMFRAEAVKIVLIVAGLGLVLASYRNIVHAAFLLTFVITIGVFAAAIAVPDAEEHATTRPAGKQ